MCITLLSKKLHNNYVNKIDDNNIQKIQQLKSKENPLQ